MKPSLKDGLSVTKRVVVDERRTVTFLGEGLSVYGTAAMVLDVEIVCRDFLLEHLDEGEDSVGVRVEIDHLGAAMAGSQVTIAARITALDGRRVTFAFEVADEIETVGRGTNVRFVLDKARQRERLQAKAAKRAELGKG